MNNSGKSRRLTLTEINDKKSKGLCFHCDEKYVPRHVCKKNKLFLMPDDHQYKDQGMMEGDKLAIMWQEEN